MVRVVSGARNSRGGVWLRAIVALALGSLCLAAGSRGEDNGQIVDPYLVGCDSTVRSLRSIPISEILVRCADADGCTMRLSYETSTGARMVSHVRSFSIDDAGVAWSVSADYLEYVVGDNGGSGSIIFLSLPVVPSGACQFSDDTQTRPFNASFELQTFSGSEGTLVTCYLRIDD